MGVIKLCYSSYQNLLYLVRKNTSGKYRLINVIVGLNQVIVKYFNLALFINKFFQKFMSYIISFFIEFFSSYNQINLNIKS